ncbi:MULTISPECIES: hypothetical protein [unclassified Paenibacillus]|uniref:hypothetical protein n=1 Tax=unclassified Paenibacillus TaxID=185978 RepID=UPI001C121AA1|nr:MULTISPECIES: hypothetical protein [unclassified Paenibacillus]MBU5441340.1 hypothetical protein [Paenibacillus sp. MSJ-34]CAH0120908.1 hypothetical protein PAE9249_03432 [Paenibacillus sp. CECT 9249]
MLKGNRDFIEAHIREIRVSPALLAEAIDTVSFAANDETSYTLFTGCFILEKPAFMFGIVNSATDRGQLMITHQCKPESFLAGFATMVRRVVPELGVNEQTELTIHFARTFGRIVRDCYSKTDGLPVPPQAERFVDMADADYIKGFY